MQRLSSRSPLPRLFSTRLAALLVVALVAADIGGFITVGRRGRAVTVDQAVARFRERQAGGADDSAEVAGSELAAAGAAAPGPAPAAAPQTVGDPDRRTGAAGSSPAGASAAGSPLPTASSSAGARPAEGVYVYGTTGGEQIDILSTRHDYPAETTMTVSHTGCGLDLRWDALRERWSQWQHCTPGRVLTLKRFTSHHDFFGQVNERNYGCGNASVFRPESTRSGDRFSGRCSSEDGSVVEMDGRVAGVETMVVGGRTVEAVHVRVDEKLSGGTAGTRLSESWYAVSDGLLLKRSSQTDADTEATFGKTHYTEDVTVILKSLTPRR